MKLLVKILIFALLGMAFARADVLSELEQYIKNRTQGAPVVTDHKCAFRQQILLQAHFHELPQDLQQLAASLLPMPTRQYQVQSPSGHFTLHYDLTGMHAVPSKDSLGNGIPDYIDSAAVILDHVWQVEIDQLGFRPPPDADGNPVQSYPVFFSSMAYYGLTSFDINQDIAALPGNNYVSYLELHRDYASSIFATKGLEGLKVTAAHEFHHAIQLGYQFRWSMENGYLVYPDVFFLEMTSTFMEDYVYDQINDYVQYVNRLIPNLETKAFDEADGNTEYANALFLHLLTQKFGVQILRDIWDNLIAYPALQAIDQTLRQYGSSFAECYGQYASWFYFTGSNSRPGSFFRDAQLFNLFRIKYAPDWLEKPLLPLHMRFNLLYVESSGEYWARVRCPESGGTLNHIADGERVLKPADFSRGQIFTQHSNLPLVAVVTNSTDRELTNMTYQIDLAPISVKDNPVKVTGSGEGVTFLHLPPGSEIAIFNILGQKIITLKAGAVNSLQWNLRNASGRQVPSGIYFYRVKAEGLNRMGKLTVLR